MAQQQANGSATPSNKKRPNKGNSKRMDSSSGQQPNGSIHGSGSRSTRSKRRARQSYSGWVLDKGAKALVWYCLFTAIFRCPSQQKGLNDDSPKMCKPYLQAKDYVTPYAQPYYDQYLSPHVKRAQPYVDQLNEKVYTPGLAAYQQHGAPRVAQAQKVGLEQWEKTVKPQLEVARQQAGKQYEAVLGPYVNKAYDAVNPQYQSLRTSAMDIWQLELEPVYRRTAPYAQKFFTQGRQFAVETALPQAQYAGSAAWTFWVRQIWPKLAVLYGENVEPQLMRITERLGRYRDEKQLEADVKSVESSSTLEAKSSSIASSVSSASSAVSEATKGASSASSVVASSSAAPSVEPREQFLGDLKSWEDVCSKAVDEGTEHLKERIDEITEHQKSTQVANVGNALVTQLEQTVEGALNSVKAHILSIVGGIPEEPSEENLEDANLALTQAIRNAGQTIKGRAQAIREWHSSYNDQTTDLINKAKESTLETIDSIRELRLTEIGRKYSDSGLTHRDWSKYNDLKKATQAWRNDVEKAAQAHNSIAASKEAAQELESKGMNIAEGAANELGRLKKVGQWKIDAQDASDDFNTKVVPAGAERARAKAAEKAKAASEAVVGGESDSTQSSVESATSAAAEKASSAVSSASEAVVGSEQPAAESVTSKVSQSAKSAASQASSVVAGSEQPIAESVTSKVAESAQSAASQASSVVSGSEQPAVESVTSKVAESVSSAASQASSVVSGSEQPAAESIASKVADSAQSVASEASSSVIGTESSLSDSLTDAASSASSFVAGTETPATESILSSLSSVKDKPLSSQSLGPKAASLLAAQKSKKDASTSSLASAATDGASSASSIVSEASDEASSAASHVADEASATASSASSKVWGGAMAQAVPSSSGPVLDDIIDDVEDTAESFSERVQEMVKGAQDQAGLLTSAIQDAIKPATSTQGTVKSAASVASEQYESAMSAASSVLFGTETRGVAEQGSQAAKEQYLSAVTAYV